MREEWTNFAGGKWESDIDVRDFIQRNYTPYDGDQSFLEGPTEATDKLWGELKELQKEERAKGGVLDMETEVVSCITAYGAAYLDKDLEKVVGLQTDKPLKRAFMPYGGIKMAEQSCQMYGYTPSPKLHEIFTKYHKTHNQGVFDIYTRFLQVFPTHTAEAESSVTTEGLLFTVLTVLSKARKRTLQKQTVRV